MKKIKLLTPIFTLATTASVVMPLVACNKGPEDPENFVGVVVTESDEDVQLEKNKAEIDKKFETLVYFDSTFAVNKVTVKVGGTGLVEGDVTSGFSYDYINNILTIAEGVIHDKVELTFKFCYVTNDIVTYSPWGHKNYLVSRNELYITNNQKEYYSYLYLDFTNWPQDDNLPNVFYFAMSPELATFPTFKSLPTVLSLGSTVEVEFIATTENKCFTLKNITRETKLLLSLEYSFEGLSVPNHYRFFGGYETK